MYVELPGPMLLAMAGFEPRGGGGGGDVSFTLVVVDEVKRDAGKLTGPLSCKRLVMVSLLKSKKLFHESIKKKGQKLHTF